MVDVAWERGRCHKGETDRSPVLVSVRQTGPNEGDGASDESKGGIGGSYLTGARERLEVPTAKGMQA